MSGILGSWLLAFCVNIMLVCWPEWVNVCFVHDSHVILHLYRDFHDHHVTLSIGIELLCISTDIWCIKIWWFRIDLKGWVKGESVYGYYRWRIRWVVFLPLSPLSLSLELTKAISVEVKRLECLFFIFVTYWGTYVTIQGGLLESYSFTFTFWVRI